MNGILAGLATCWIPAVQWNPIYSVVRAAELHIGQAAWLRSAEFITSFLADSGLA
jgi:hypothetical protein